MSLGCHCGGSCCSKEQPGLGFFSGITAQQAAQQAAALSKAWNSKELANITSFAQAGYIDDHTPGYQYCPSCSSECGGQPAPNLNLFQTGSKLVLSAGAVGTSIALATGAITAATAGIIGAATMGIGTIIGLYSIFQQHHAQAVAKEQSTLCAAVPAANNYLQVIEHAVASGAATPQQGIQALDSLLSDFKSSVGSILKMDASHCNAACYLIIALTAIVNYWKSVYQDYVTQQAAAATVAAAPVPAATVSAPITSAALAVDVVTTRPNTVSASPMSSTAANSFSDELAAIPSWMKIAAAVVGGLILVEAL
jgi:hypothetical protein